MHLRRDKALEVRVFGISVLIMLVFWGISMVPYLPW